MGTFVLIRPAVSTGAGSAAFGVRAETSQEAFAQGRSGPAGCFVAEYAVLTAEAHRTGAKIFFADEAHFQADGDLRGEWVLQGEPALVDSTSPRRGDGYVGGLAGMSDGATSGSYATGDVSGKSSVGGLIGSNGSGTVVASYAVGAVSGGDDNWRADRGRKRDHQGIGQLLGRANHRPGNLGRR